MNLCNWKKDSSKAFAYMRMVWEFGKIKKKVDLKKGIFFFSIPGHPLRSVLLALREMDGSVYKQLQVDFQRYAGCIGIVDTGYFKRSSASDMKSKRTFQSKHGYDGDLQLLKPLTSKWVIGICHIKHLKIFIYSLWWLL